MFDYMGAFLFRSGFAHVDNVITKRCSKTITWLLLSRLQGNKPHRNSPEPSETLELSGTLGTFRKLPPEPTPAHNGTVRNLPELASGTYTSTRRNSPEPFGTCLQNLHQQTPELSGTVRNLPELASGTYTSTRRNSPEPFGTCLQNLHQQTPELSGTVRNSPEPASGTYTSTHRNSPEPSSGTCSCDPHRHTPELIWAEDPISLRCWGKILYKDIREGKKLNGNGTCCKAGRWTVAGPIVNCEWLDETASIVNIFTGLTGLRDNCIIWLEGRKVKMWFDVSQSGCRDLQDSTSSCCIADNLEA